MQPRVLVGQFAGAAGTLASLGDDGLEVHAALMASCDLGRARHRPGMSPATGLRRRSVPRPRHRQPRQDRDRRHADDGRRRSAEAFEPFVAGTRLVLDHAAEAQPDLLRTDPRRRQGRAPAGGLMLDGMVADFERATGPWHLEWIAIPRASSPAAARSRRPVHARRPDRRCRTRMRRQPRLTGGLIVAEAVMMGLPRPSAARGARPRLRRLPGRPDNGATPSKGSW